MKTLNFKLSFVVAALSIYLAFFALDKAQMEFLYIKTAYLFIFINFSIWLYKLWNILPSFSELKGFIKFHKNAIVISLLLTVMAFVSCKANFRIFSDETNLLSISKCIVTYPHEISNIIFEVEKNDELIPVWILFNKRPLLFPFVLSFFHRLLGYTYLNAFLLNCISLFMCLFLLYYIVYSFFDKFYGCLSIVIMASYPLIVACSTSAGFEIFDLLWALIVFIVLHKFLLSKDVKLAEFLIYTALLFAQTRYEELAILPIIIVFVWIYLDKNQFEHFTKAFSIFPIFCIPLVWLNIITYKPSNFDFGLDAKIYGFEHFFPNLRDSVCFLLGHDNGGMITIFSIVSVAAFFVIFFDRKIYHYCKQSIILRYVLCFYITHVLLRFTFIGCILTKPMAYRLAVIFVPCFIVLTIFFMFKLISKYKFNKSLICCLLLFILVFSWSKINYNNYFTLNIHNYFYVTNPILERYFPNKKDYLLVSSVPNLFPPLDISSVDFDFFDKHLDEFRNDIIYNKTWKYIVIVDASFTFDGYKYKSLDEEFMSATKLIFMREFNGGNIKISVWNPNNYDLKSTNMRSII